MAYFGHILYQHTLILLTPICYSMRRNQYHQCDWTKLCHYMYYKWYGLHLWLRNLAFDIDRDYWCWVLVQKYRFSSPNIPVVFISLKEFLTKLYKVLEPKNLYTSYFGIIKLFHENCDSQTLFSCYFLFSKVQKKTVISSSRKFFFLSRWTSRNALQFDEVYLDIYNVPTVQVLTKNLSTWYQIYCLPVSVVKSFPICLNELEATPLCYTIATLYRLNHAEGLCISHDIVALVNTLCLQIPFVGHKMTL